MRKRAGELDRYVVGGGTLELESPLARAQDDEVDLFNALNAVSAELERPELDAEERRVRVGCESTEVSTGTTVSRKDERVPL